MAKQQLPPPDDVITPVHYGNLDYSNPHQQVVHPRWAGGEVVWSIPCGPVAVSPEETNIADVRYQAWRSWLQPPLAAQLCDCAA